MTTLNKSVNISGLGGAITRSVNRTGDGGGNSEINVPIGYAGSLTTRTDDETGSITMSSGSHGISTADVVDLYWTGGARYGVTVGTVSGTTVPIGADNSGTGDVLPSAATALVVSTQVAFNAAIDGDNVALLGIQMLYGDTSETASSRLSLLDSGSSEIAGLTLAANDPRVYDISGGDTNVFTGNPITNGVVSNGSVTNAGTLKMLWVQDTTP